ncbi:hypothetical protein LTR91_025469 [Friedmanniomyces endolithicus]|uniref:Sialidase domain-containing protein n=1 Tax=Friedmanniomyces endolithicus TaxID=329885 RepID=A0AAN6GZQ3_9PEZI|nr:hypothetical protein LTR59_015198 [Friedmanniomyces endolithicus]KAK0777928.1 hypothetical protein LTR38_014986 [Friedmanniomyces endolithicus]KAK0779445.1 hypothetical protein LTR75_015346 [Friedmanniomyces endolithicus]KAK0860479.1 hypothetical protein LTR87_017295 [Friedmanniomyces endolithicus]KAK0886828.1 hypothetical protein LTR02_017792 [Friedmanniomyces endolithicus]
MWTAAVLSSYVLAAAAQGIYNPYPWANSAQSQSWKTSHTHHWSSSNEVSNAESSPSTSYSSVSSSPSATTSQGVSGTGSSTTSRGSTSTGSSTTSTGSTGTGSSTTNPGSTSTGVASGGSSAIATPYSVITPPLTTNWTYEVGTNPRTVPSLAGATVDMTSGRGGTYPRANFLHDGSILGAYTGFSNGNNVLTLVRSTDKGAFWSLLGTAATEASNANDLDNPYPLQLPSGRVLLAYRNHSKNATTGVYLYYRITISFSDDNGVTWSYLSTPASDPAGPNGNWEPFLRNAADGSLQLYYSRENSADDQDSLMRTSTDAGKTWSTATIISGTGVTARDGMLGVATISGSSLLAVFESEQDGLFTVNSITSFDDGKTWGNRQRVYTPTGTNNNAGAPQIVTVGGTLCVSFMTDEDTQQHHWIIGADDKIITSGDGGATWGNKITVFGVQSNWPAMLSLDRKSLLYMADFRGPKAQKINLD